MKFFSPEVGALLMPIQGSVVTLTLGREIESSHVAVDRREENFLPFLVVHQRVISRKSSVFPRFPPAGECFLFRRTTFKDLRFSRR